MNRVFILLGSNLGDRSLNLSTALEHIAAKAGSIERISGVYVTAAWGKSDQPDFYNQVIEVSTSRGPQDLLDTLMQIEREMGRQRIEKWGTRLIDLDILFYGNTTFQSETLVIPHPELANRRFTLEPLAEIASELIHPLSGLTVRELLAACPDNLPVKRL